MLRILELLVGMPKRRRMSVVTEHVKPFTTRTIINEKDEYDVSTHKSEDIRLTWDVSLPHLISDPDTKEFYGQVFWLRAPEYGFWAHLVAHDSDVAIRYSKQFSVATVSMKNGIVYSPRDGKVRLSTELQNACLAKTVPLFDRIATRMARHASIAIACS